MGRGRDALATAGKMPALQVKPLSGRRESETLRL